MPAKQREQILFLQFRKLANPTVSLCELGEGCLFGFVCGQVGMFQDSPRSAEAPSLASLLSSWATHSPLHAILLELHRSEISRAFQLCSLIASELALPVWVKGVLTLNYAGARLTPKSGSFD